MDSIRYILVVQHVCNELSAAVRFVSRRESTAEHEDMTLVDILLHLSDRPEDVFFSKVAEYAHADLRTGIAPCLRRIIVTVGSREYRQICYRFLYWLSLISEIRLLCLERLNAIKSCRNSLAVVSLGSVRINLRKTS